MGEFGESGCGRGIKLSWQQLLGGGLGRRYEEPSEAAMRLVATLALFDVYHSSLAPRVQTRRVIAYAKDQWIHGQLQLYAANSLQARYLIPVYLSCLRDRAVRRRIKRRSTVVRPDAGSIRSRSIIYRVEICETVHLVVQDERPSPFLFFFPFLFLAFPPHVGFRETRTLDKLLHLPRISNYHQEGLFGTVRYS